MRPSHRTTLATLVLAVALAGAARAQDAGHPAHGSGHHMDHAAMGMSHGAAQSDTGFAALQERGKTAMGVDQYTSTHRFDALPDGGRIELRRGDADSAGVARIRAHMREIAAAFAAGDFRTPLFVHAREVPGTGVMAARRRLIRYAVRDLPGGAELRLTTTDSRALAAIRDFMAFQREDHHSGGADR